MPDSHGRPINYLHLSITDRGNLRCRFWMPAGGMLQQVITGKPARHCLGIEQRRPIPFSMASLGG